MRFIHLADVHLGAVPDRGYPWSARREEEIWESFRRLIAALCDDPADFLLISGDLFHRQPLLKELKETASLFEQIPSTRVYLMAGNHDYLKKDSLYRHFRWPSNVFFFPGETPRRVRDPYLPVYIYGLSYEHQEIPQNLYEGLYPWEEEDEDQDGEAYHILMAHGGDAEHIPLRAEDLVDEGFDYVALGHIHKPQILIKDRAAYCGALEPIDRGDTGMHGFIEGWTDHGRLLTRFRPFACRSYEKLTVQVTPQDNRITLEDKVKEAIHTAGAGNIYQIFLEGERASEQVFLAERLRRLGNVLEVHDHTRISLDLEELYHSSHGTIIGDYIALFYPEMAEGKTRPEQKLDSVQEKALYYGLQALLETSAGYKKEET